MKILLLSHYFPPEGNAPANRSFAHCKEWAQSGHEVHVITCVPSHPRGIPYDGYRVRLSQYENLSGIHVHRIWTYLAANKGFGRRTLNYISYMPAAILKAQSLGNFDVIVATSPQFFTAVTGWSVSHLKRTPWIFELRDIWPESIRAVGSIKNEKLFYLLEKLERFLYRDASAIVCVTKSFVDNLNQRGIPPDKLKYIPNGVYPDAWPQKNRETVRRHLGVAKDDVLVTYIGTVGLAHGIGTVIACAKQLSRHFPNIRLVVVGDGAELDDLKATAEGSQLPNLTFTGLVQKNKIPDYMAATDISLVLLKKSKLFTTVLPSKMFESMAAHKPIILGVEGEAAQLLTKANAGIAVSPEDSVAMTKAICRLASDTALRHTLGTNGKNFVSQYFHRSTLANDMLTVLKQIAMGQESQVD